MKTVYKIVKEYNERNEANTTLMYGFKVGDKVKTTSEYDRRFDYKGSGEIIKVDGEVVTFKMEHKVGYNLKALNEYWLMPDN